MNTKNFANNRQVGGTHYFNPKTGSSLQHWDVVRMFDLDYFQGNITKYVFRWKEKGGVEDLKKAAHYLEKYIETIEQEIEYDQERENMEAYAQSLRDEQDGEPLL